MHKLPEMPGNRDNHDFSVVLVPLLLKITSMLIKLNCSLSDERFTSPI